MKNRHVEHTQILCVCAHNLSNLLTNVAKSESTNKASSSLHTKPNSSGTWCQKGRLMKLAGCNEMQTDMQMGQSLKTGHLMAKEVFQ